MHTAQGLGECPFPPPKDNAGLHHHQELMWTVIICCYKNLHYSVSKDRELQVINVASIDRETATIKSRQTGKQK